MNENQSTDVATAEEVERLSGIRRLQKRIWAWPLAGVPIIFVAGSVRPEYGLVVFFVLAAFFFVLTTQHMLARCPRCQQYFNWSGGRRHKFADACVNCGLELGARSEDQARLH